MARSLSALDADPSARHRGFLLHRRQIYVKFALGACTLAVAAYVFSSPVPRHSGGDWLGYVLGVASTLLIVWLTMIGVRKRKVSPGRWSLKAWTSAHVYLGLSLLVLATLHTGFQFGWNIHTLAYTLMLIVIASGLVGVYLYATIPSLMSDNRGEVGQAQMLEAIVALDVDLQDAAQPLDEANAALVRSSINERIFSRSLRVRLARSHPQCPTAKGMEALRNAAAMHTDRTRDELIRVITLLERKQALLDRTRRHVRYRTLLELWLYVHVPFTFALLVALSIHIFSVFYFW